MTQTAELRLPGARTEENRLVAVVCFAHFVSHLYIMLLAPLFLFVREDFGASYTELGLALTAFNVVSTILQTPTGFLVDRVRPRIVIIAGLLLGSCAFALAALATSLWLFVAMFAIAGVGQTVYHPADYALLSKHVSGERLGRVFSYHTFSGMIGNAAAPPMLLLLYGQFGWRGAFLGTAALGVFAAIPLVMQSDLDSDQPRVARKTQETTPAAAPSAGWRLLMAPPILLSFLFYILLSFCGGGLNNYLVVTLGALYNTPLTVANTALTALLSMSAVGVLVGGVLTGRTSRHGLVAASGLVVTALVCAFVGIVDFNALALVLLMAAAGFFSGITMPSRDMIVRSITPPGAYGRVFGFVSSGFNVAGIVTPLIFGQLLDHGYPRAIFFFMAGCALLAIVTVVVNTSRPSAAGAPQDAERQG